MNDSTTSSPARRTGTGEKDPQSAYDTQIAQTALQSIGMSTRNFGGPFTSPPEYALAVSIIFTKATNQAIMLGTEPRHVLSTSILCNSLLHDKRFKQVTISEAAPGDIIVASGGHQAVGYAGILVDHGRIVSNSSLGVQNNSSLLEIQRNNQGMAIFRYIGVRRNRSRTLANANFDPIEPRLPAGQPGGGQWTGALNPNRMTRAEELLPPLPKTADTNIDTVNKKLALDATYSRPRKKSDQIADAKRGIYITHYGPGTKIGGWDPYNDSGTNSGFGLGGKGETPLLNNYSLALSADVAKSSGISPGDPVYVNGRFIGFYNDRSPEPGTIDIYDEYNCANDIDWGGMVWSATVTNHP